MPMQDRTGQNRSLRRRCSTVTMSESIVHSDRDTVSVALGQSLYDIQIFTLSTYSVLAVSDAYFSSILPPVVVVKGHAGSQAFKSRAFALRLTVMN